MNKIIISAAAFAAVFGAVALVASARRSSSTSTAADTDTPTTPEPQTTAGTSPDAPSIHDIGRIDLSQIHPGGSRRRIRISSQHVPVSDHREERAACNHSAQPVVKPTVTSTEKSTEKHGRRSPLDGKESGNWEMPRVVVSAIILLHGKGMSIWQISKATGLGARSISRVLSGGAPTPCPTSCATLLAA